MSGHSHKPMGEQPNSGYTLVEVVVALALLVTVLVPTAAALVFIVQRPDVPLRMEALSRAQSATEQTLNVPPDVWLSTEEVDGLWRIRREVERTENLAAVTVSVHRGQNESPLASLTTARFVAPEVQE